MRLRRRRPTTAKEMICRVVFLLGGVLVFFAGVDSADAAARARVHHDETGWRLKVDEKDFFVKGVVWGYTPKNETYTYNLWTRSDEFIRDFLDYEFGSMRAIGVNAIRTFATIPPKWVSYIYHKHGIMTAINPLMGRYGSLVGGIWRPYTNYADPATRRVLKREFIETVKKYKDTPGVLLFALGNESNYGLSWKSFEIENLPVGERNEKKARYLYTLFQEAIEEGKRIAPDHLFTIVNGDIQYIDLIAELMPNLDLLGVNAYRGRSFGALWRDVEKKLGIPVLFFEFGADAFNSRTFKEDQPAQASYLNSQWREIYRKSAGHGQEGSALGGFVFEWRDEWWKYRQTENLDIHDKTASWGNGGYKYDYIEGANNMNEEWWGINRMGAMSARGFYEAEPRIAYDTLRHLWRIDPYRASRRVIDRAMISFEDQSSATRSEAVRLSKRSIQADPYRLAGASVRMEMIGGGFESEIDEDGLDGAYNSHGLMGFLNFEFEPTPNLSGDFTLNFIADASDSEFEFKYGDRVIDEVGPSASKFEIYDLRATYRNANFDLNTFYHTPRYHWGNEGDFFGLLRETTDMEGEDIWNSKAPYGVEYVGKDSMDGLKIVVGPEIYWGANPKGILKYQFGPDKAFTFIHAQDLARRSGASDGGNEATSPRATQTTLQGRFDLGRGVELTVGALMANMYKVGEKYDYIENSTIVEDEIDFMDTLSAKANVAFDLTNRARAYLMGTYAGLVADGGERPREFDTRLPYSEYGDKWEAEAGALVSFGAFSLYPRALYRENLIDANPLIEPEITGTTLLPGIEPRDRDDDPFAVLSNRSARAGELYLTYDPTPETPFYAYDNDLREDAPFAFNVGLTMIRFNTAADSELFYYKEGKRNARFGRGLDADDLWTLTSKLVFNPLKSLKILTKFEAGKAQTEGKPVEAITYYKIEGELIWDRRDIIGAKFKKDSWGPYDFERQFNLTYPEQYELKYVRLLERGRELRDSSRFGVKLLHRTLDENSPAKFYRDGLNTSMSEIQTFVEYRFDI